MKRILLAIAALVAAGNAVGAYTPYPGTWNPSVDWSPATWHPIDYVIPTPTKYVDNTNGSCDDNGDGSSGTPYCNIPSTITNEIVKIVAGTYTYSNKDNTVTLTGTTTTPAVLQCASGVLIRSSSYGTRKNIVYAGDDFIIDGCTYRWNKINVGADNTDQRVVFRNNDVGYVDRNCLSISGTAGVLYNNEAHHCIDNSTVGDKHGIYVGNLSSKIHIIDNVMHHTDGDGLQFCHKCNPGPNTVVMAGNEAYSTRENAFDYKYATGLVISSNKLHTILFAPKPDVPFSQDDCVSNAANYSLYNLSCTSTSTSGSDGAIAVLGSDGAPSKMWFIFNEVYNGINGIRIEQASEVTIYGNIIHDLSGQALITQKDAIDTYVCNNNFYNIDTGWFHNFRQDTFSVYFTDNILSELTDGIEINDTGSILTGTSIIGNVFYNSSASMAQQFGPNNTFNVTSTGDISASNFSGAAAVTGNVWGDPDYDDAANGDFTLGVSSAALTNGDTCHQLLQARWDADFPSYTSVDIDVDYVGNTMADDSGALASGSSPPTPTDNPPTCVTCQSSPFTEDAGNASYSKSVTLTDDFSSVTVNDVVFTPTVSDAGNWAFDGSTISYTGTTVVETVTLNFDMSDGVNADKAAQIVLNFQTAEAQVPPIAGSVPNQSNQETDTIAIPIPFTLTNGDALTACAFGASVPSNYTQSLSATLNNDCTGTASGYCCVEGTLEEYAAAVVGGGVTVLTTTPITALTNAESGTVTIAPEGVTDYALLMCHSSQASAARTYTDMTVDSVSATSSIFASVDGGRAAMAGCYIWVESALPTTNGTYNWALTLNTGAVADELYFFAELSGVDQTTGFGTTTATTTSTSLASGGSIAPAAITDGEGELVLSLLAISDTSSDATANNSVDPTQADTVVIAPTYNRDAANGEHGLGVSFDTSGASASETYTWTAAFNPTTTIDSAVSLAVTILSSGGGGTPEVIGAATNSPHSVEVCATDNDGTSSPCATYTHTVTTAGSNQAPVAQDDSYIYNPGETNTYDESDSVLNNDTDPDSGDVISVSTTLVTQPGSGTVTLATDGTFTYTPGPGYTGDTFFDYTLTDDAGSPLTDVGRAFLLAVDVPVISQPTTAATYSVNVEEGSSGTITTIQASNPLDGYTKGSTMDCGDFVIDIDSGAVTWDQTLHSGLTPAYTGVDDAYPCPYSANNGSGSDTITITVNVTDNGAPADPPVIFSSGGGSTALVSAAENQVHIVYARAYDTTSWALCGGVDDSLVSVASTTTTVGTFTTNFAVDANQLTVTAHNLIVGEEVTLTTTGTLPTGLSTGTSYYVKTVNDANNVELAATVGGTVITLTGDGSGTHTITRASPIAKIEFDSAPNYENPIQAGATDNDYLICVQPTGPGGTDTQMITARVTDVAEQPVVTSADTASILSGSTSVSPAQTCDESGSVFVEVTDTGALFTISSSGQITKDTAASYDPDTPANNAFSYTYKCTKTGASDSSNKTITINIIPTVTDERECSSRAVIGRFLREARRCALY